MGPPGSSRAIRSPLQPRSRSGRAAGRPWRVLASVALMLPMAASEAGAGRTVVLATKTARLVVDRDDDGRADPGDTLEYRIVLENAGSADAEAVLFEDVPDSNSRLVVGSVSASQGSVLSGNTAGDAIVEIDFGILPVGASAQAAFRVAVGGGTPGGVFQLWNQGTVTGENLAPALTDDPTTGASDDATVSPVADAPLGRCERDIGGPEGEPAHCEEGLRGITRDRDEDDVLDVVDTCPDTPAALEVDAFGCSRSQFCGGVRASSWAWHRRLRCALADWKDDELFAAGDCQWREGACAPRDR